ncbi:MAG: integrase arm-type DNA-binding domain-containing protein, partial [Pseudomonadales bacterium]|nr:integrase arm-type DNA-binding domain-containing protein [Pseudomonadales bacterium]
MPRIAKPLSDTEIRQAKPRDREYSLADGKNLYLRVQPSGGKYWILNYYRPGTRKRANIGLGAYPDISLALAHKRADELRAALAEGIDPQEYREAVNRERSEKNANTFEHVSRKWLALKKSSVSTVYYDKIVDRLEKYIFPKMGKTPIHKVSAVTAIEIIQPLASDEKLETVKKICRWVNEIMVYAVN